MLEEEIIMWNVEDDPKNKIDSQMEDINTNDDWSSTIYIFKLGE